MRGYKALNEDMSSKYGNMTYELNKEYEIDKRFKILMCKNGYHFCTKLINVFTYYPSDSRVFEIDTLDGEIIESKNKDKYCTSKIKLIREVSKEEINKYIEDNLDKLINDKTPYVRAEVANQGYGLNILINDESPFVRTAVAKQGYNLDKLINDEDSLVRLEVAKQGYGLDILINDKDSDIKEIAIKQLYEDKE